MPHATFGHGGGDEHAHALMERLAHSLATLSDPSTEEGELFGIVAKVLLEVYPEEADKFSEEVELAKKTLREKFKIFAEERWRARPHTLKQGFQSAKDFSKQLMKIIMEIPPEIAAQAYSGYHEFGLLYLGIVGTTYPPWFLGSEAVEHIVLSAPVGMACTYLQLGYFAVIKALIAPVSSLCSYVAVDLNGKTWFQRLGAIPKSVALALQDYLRLRLIKGKYRVISFEGISPLLETSQRRLQLSLWFDKSSGPIRSLAKNRALWPVLLGFSRDFVNKVDWARMSKTTPDEKLRGFSLTYERFVVLGWIMNQMTILIKELRDEKEISFRQYMYMLRLNAYVSRDLRQLFIAERKFGADHNLLMTRVLPEILQVMRFIEKAEEGTLTTELILLAIQEAKTCDRFLLSK